MIPICGGAVQRCYRVIFWSCFINFIMHDCVVVIVIYYGRIVIVYYWRHIYSTVWCLFTVTLNIDRLVFFLHVRLTILLFVWLIVVSCVGNAETLLTNAIYLSYALLDMLCNLLLRPLQPAMTDRAWLTRHIRIGLLLELSFSQLAT